MRAIFHLLIEPRQDAREHFASVVGEDADLLLESVLLDPEANSLENIIALAKLVFLARVREYDPFSSTESAVRIFGSDEISVDVFDRWWTIRQVEYDFSFDTMVNLFLAPLATKVRTHGDAQLAKAIEYQLRKNVR